MATENDEAHNSPQVSKAAREQDSVKHASYVIKISKFQHHELVFVDESSFDHQVSLCNCGWALVGQRTILNTFFVKGKRYVGLSAPHATKLATFLDTQFCLLCPWMGYFT